MSENTANNKRIAKNTMVLYFRMLLRMGVMFYTSRVVLSALGVNDYGIYNVVGGVVTMFTMISGSLSSAISRFITFELGRRNQERLNVVFSTSVIIQVFIAIIIAILVETVGVWFLANKMVIPPDRFIAANWVLQFSLIALIINLISIPYNAAIIAHERMGAYAYISIIDAVGNLAIAYFITISPIDKLIFYAILMTVLALLVCFTYTIYCRLHFEECKFKWLFDKHLLMEMFGFSGWNFLGTSSMLLRDQGVNIILNMFGGPAVNAARGIATQVNVAVNQFSTNFMMALNPQIVKSYATGDKEYLMTLIYQGSRLSFYMILILSLPVFLNTEYVLALWLNIVPEHTVLFVQLTLLFGMMQAVQTPLITAILATGNLRNIQLLVGFFQMMNVPLSYVMLKYGMSPETVVTVAIVLSFCCLMSRLYMLRGMIGISFIQFTKKVLLNVLLVSIVSFVVPYIVSTKYLQSSFLSFVNISLLSLFCTSLSIYFLGCSKMERQFINNKLMELKKKMF